MEKNREDPFNFGDPFVLLRYLLTLTFHVLYIIQPFIQNPQALLRAASTVYIIRSARYLSKRSLSAAMCHCLRIKADIYIYYKGRPSCPQTSCEKEI